ncbi:hypothetical protein HR12_40070 [Microbacterium sp. SUBG005]|nr:hypothetical protein HR12_40070 [Microbacterium sp. SUBG005]
MMDGLPLDNSSLAGPIQRPRASEPTFFSSEREHIGGQDYAAVARHGPFGDSPSAPSYLDANSAAQEYVAMIAMGLGDQIPEWGDPGQRDEFRLDEADRERYG